MRILLLTLHTRRPSRSLKAGRGRPTPLRAEELEPRTLLSAPAPVGAVAQPLHEILLPTHTPGQPPGGHRPPQGGPGGVAPGYNPGQSPGGYWPSQIRHVYGFDKLTLDGTGQTIAVVDAFHDPNMASDLATFDAQFNLSAPASFRQIDQNGNPAGGVPQDSTGNWEVEEALDVEWAHAVAPKASILLVEANSNSFNDLLTAVDTARNASGVVAVSMSWGGGEDPSETGIDSHFTTPSGHIGVTFVASSGDNGAPGGYPAMSPNVLAIGGTSLALDGSDNRTSEFAWNGSGGGPSSVEGEPAYQSTYAQSSYVQNTLGNTVLLNSPRGNPDVSYVSDPAPGVAIYDTFPNQFGISGWAAIGGTSDAAPQWAGLVALVAQGRGTAGSLDGVTQTLPALYRLGASPTAYPNDFFDVTSGSNGFSAQAGYDFATGLGSPRADHLVPDLIGNQGTTGAASLSVTASTGNPVAGQSFSVTVTALNAAGQTFTGYAGTVHFTTSDKGTGVALPADYTFVAGDNGSHTFTGVTLVTAGAQTVTAADTANGAINGQANVTVGAAAAATLTVGAPSSTLQGAPFTVTVTAKDAFGNTATGYRGTAHFTSSDTAPGVALPPNYTFVAGDNGSHTFTNGFTLVTVGTQTVTATDTVTGSITGQASVNVTPDVATHFSVSAPSAATAGQSFSVIVTALDANNHTVTGYAGTVHFTSSDGQAALPGDATLTNGTGTFTATLKTAGSQTVTAADTANGAITGQANVTVSAAAASTLVLGAPSSATADAPFTVTVTAKDAFGNTATGYRGTVGFTSSDTAPGVVLPQSYTFTSTDNGAHTFTSGVTLMTAGAQTITATDTLTGSITGQATLTVTPAVATHLGVSAPASATAGSAFTVTVTALDANNHTVTGYAGTVHFTTTDGRAGVALPSDYTFVSSDHGMHTFTGGVTLVTAGAQTITATDTLTGSVTGQAGVTVSAAAASKLTVSAPSSTLQGAPFTVTVTAKDAFGNTATGYRGTVHFTSSDTAPGVALPPNYTFVAGDNGSHTFTNGFTLVTVGTKAVTATDTVTGSITGQASVTVTQRQSGNLIVNPGFETGNFSGWSINAAPDSSYFGVIGSNPHSGHYGAYFGSYYFERDDIYQNVPTIPGHTYRISYWVANDGGGDTEIRSSWGGTVLEDRFPNNTFPYQQHTFTRVATSTSTEFRIGGYQIPAIWYLDDVSVTDTTAAGAFRGGTGPNIATGNGRTATFSGSGPQAVLPGDATRAGQGSAGAPAHGGGPAAGADHAALDAVMAGLAQGGLNFGQPVAFGQPFEGPQAPDPGLLNALFGGAAFTLPGDGGTGLTGADGMSQPGPGHRPRPSGG